MIKKNQTYHVTIQSLNDRGQGVSYINDFPVYIDNTLPQEEVEIKIVKVLRKFAFAIVIKHHTHSPHRVAIIDPKATQTGIMPLQHMNYDYQLKYKKQQVIDALKGIRTLQQIDVKNTIGMDYPYQYRNKAQVPVVLQQNQVRTGFYRRGSHELIAMDDFYIQDPEIDQIIIKIRKMISQLNISIYNETSHQGIVRNIIVRKGINTQEIMIILVTTTEKIPQLDELTKQIVDNTPNLVSLFLNINKKKTNVIMGKDNKLLYGQPYYKEIILKKEYFVSPHSFLQVNTKQAEQLYRKALDLADLQTDEIVIDAYCGIGTITLSIADHVKHVYGIEIIQQAVAMAEKNAEHNKIENVSFLHGKAEELITDIASNKENIDTIFVDPPRKGLDQNFIETSSKMKANKIVYISCNPTTLARDLNIYQKLGYQTKLIQPVDMFPQTTHVETIALLKRIK